MEPCRCIILSSILKVFRWCCPNDEDDEPIAPLCQSFVRGFELQHNSPAWRGPGGCAGPDCEAAGANKTGFGKSPACRHTAFQRLIRRIARRAQLGPVLE